MLQPELAKSIFDKASDLPTARTAYVVEGENGTIEHNSQKPGVNVNGNVASDDVDVIVKTTKTAMAVTMLTL